jgi:opacity protein-like surface antigen
MLALLLAAAAASQVPPDLAAAVAAYDKAQVDGDRAQLGRWLADDYLLLNSSGKLETKVELIADYTAQGFDLEPFTVEQPVEKVWTDGAVMGGIATLRGTDSGKRYELRLRFADVWAKRKGRWQVVYTQVAKAP